MIVAEDLRCFVFSNKRWASMGVLSKARSYLGVYNDILLAFLRDIFQVWSLQFDFDEILEMSLRSLEISDSLIESNSKSEHIWNVIGMWTASDLSFATSERKLIGVKEGNSFASIRILLQDGSVHIIDASVIDSTWPSIRFLYRKWFLVGSLGVVVLLFSLNEMQPHHSSRSNAIFFMVIYIVILILTLGVVLID